MERSATFSLHVGAHKTATTYLQSRLDLGGPHLRDHGILFEPMPRFRRAFTDPLWRAFRAPSPQPGPEELKAVFAQYLEAAPRRFIASDENLVGRCSLHGQVYRDSKARFAFLKACLPAAPSAVVLNIREYSGWIASYYSESLRWQPFVTFEAYKRSLRLTDGLWVRIVDGLVDVFGAGTVKVLRYEALQARFPALLAMLCGEPIDPAQLPDSDDRREGFSAAAIEDLAKRAETHPGRLPAAVIDAAMQRFPRSPAFPAFAPWSAEEARELKALYERHLAEIERRHPGIFI